MASAGWAAAPTQPFIVTGVEADAPRGFVNLCRRDTAYCSAGKVAGDRKPASSELGARAEAAPAPALPAALAAPWAERATYDLPRALVVDPLPLLKRLNRWVNGHVRQRTDAEIFGEGEVWKRSGTGGNAVGDCEDIALEKRFQLLQAGFPSERLFLAVVYERTVGLHAVLVVRTPDGDVVLDSLTPHVVPWSKAPYRWVAIQSTEDPLLWRSLGSPQDAANAAHADAHRG